MLPKFFFELDTGDQQIVDRTESDAAKEILNRMPNSAKEFARAVNVTLANQMNKAPDGFRDRTNDIRDNIKQLSETGDVKNLIVEIDLFKTFLQEISDIYSTFRTNALNNTMKEEPFNSMDASVLSQSKKDIFDYLSEAKKEYPAFKEMSDGIIDALKEVNDFDYAKAEIRKPDLTNVVNELTNTIFDNKENIQETEKMLQSLLEKSDSEAKNVEELEKEVEEENKDNKDLEMKSDIDLSNKVDEPKPLAEAVKRFEDSLSDFDKNVLSNYYEGKNFGSYVKGDLVTSGCTNKMTPEGIVLLCAMSLYHAFPKEGVGVSDDDIDLRMESIKYSGGASNAVIRYSIPDESKGAEFDSEEKRYGSDIDSQWLEARISPDVKMKEGKGRAELVIRTFDPNDQSKLVTNRGKRTSVVEFIKNVAGQGDSKRKSKW